MNAKTIETDYLVIGGGDMGTAFTDEILNRDPKAHVTIVDRRERLAGHWNDAYPYVRLHQPAAFYGVNSKILGDGSNDLSSKEEILDYYDDVLGAFQNTGKFTFLGGYDYQGDSKASACGDPAETVAFTVRRRIVDATYMGVEIPATHAPKFDVDPDVNFVPLNDLPEQKDNYTSFVVLGCGKTGMDAIQYLLSENVSPDAITWVMPNDMWCFDRARIQIGSVMDSLMGHGLSIIREKTANDVFLAQEKTGGIIRINENALPAKWKCATVSEAEITQLRSITNTICKGRIAHLGTDKITFQSGESVDHDGSALFVNCTADGLAPRKSVPVFAKGKIELQSVFFCQQVFSAAAIARLELTNLTDEKRNLVKPVPHPLSAKDWPISLSATVDNVLRLHRYFPLWMFRSRLNFLSHEPALKYFVYALRAAHLSRPLRKAAQKMAA